MIIPNNLELLARFIMALCIHWNANYANCTGLRFVIHSEYTADFQI